MSNLGTIDLKPRIQYTTRRESGVILETRGFELDADEVENLSLMIKFRLVEGESEIFGRASWAGEVEVRRKSYWWFTHMVQSR